MADILTNPENLGAGNVVDTSMGAGPEVSSGSNATEDITGQTGIQEKLFTQAELDSIVQARLARERQKMPSEKDLAAFRQWKESQQDDKEKLAEMRKERDTARADLSSVQEKLETLERERLLLGKGIPAEDVDYYAFKIGKLVTEDKTFSQAMEEYLKSGNKRTGKNVTVQMGASFGGNQERKRSIDEQMNDIIRGFRKGY